jgi:hypothetical protein
MLLTLRCRCYSPHTCLPTSSQNHHKTRGSYSPAGFLPKLCWPLQLLSPLSTGNATWMPRHTCLASSRL